MKKPARTMTGVMLSLLLCAAMLPARGASVNPEAVTQAEVNELKAEFTYYVDAKHKKSSDKNSGAEKEPFLTIGAATRKATENRKNGKGTKIVIKPGIYREVIKMINVPANAEAPIIFEGTSRDDVRIRGSIVLAGEWVKEGDYYTHEWKMDWGPSRDIYADEFDINIEEIVRRKEMIVVNERLLLPANSLEEVSPGKFFVDNSAKKAYIIPFEDQEVTAESVEVPIYDQGFSFHETGDVLLRNLTVEFTNPYHTSSAVSMYKVKNMLVEDCNFSSNNWAAMGVYDAQNITLNRVTMNDNGGAGVLGAGIDNMLIQDCETSYNNWRGNLGSFWDWDTGGIKLLFAYDVVVRGHEAHGNLAPGIWFDSECRNVLIEDCITTGNESGEKGIVAGIYIEGNKGPILVRNCIVRDNKRGFNLSSSNDVKIENTQIANNRTSQLYIFGNWGQGRTFKERFSENNVTSFNVDHILENVVISAGPGNTEPLITYDYGDKAGYVVWLKATTWNNVSVYHPDSEKAFLMMDSESRGELAAWMEASGKTVEWVPAAPQNLKMQENGKSVVLSWEKSADEADGYIVYRNGKEIARTESLEYTDTIETGKGYLYEIAAYKSGSVSARSNYTRILPPVPTAADVPLRNPLLLALGIAALGLLVFIGVFTGVNLGKRKKKKS